MKYYAVFLFAIVFFAVQPVKAQERIVTVDLFFPGMVEPVVARLPLPDYPDNAWKAGLGGRVSVPVTINASGVFVVAGDASGPYPVCRSVTDERVLALRAAAVTAAKRSKFGPEGVDFNMPGVAGRINYFFNPPKIKTKPEGTLGVKVEKFGEPTGKDADGGPVGEGSDRIEVKPTDPPDKGLIKPGAAQPVDQARVVGESDPRTVSGGVLNGKALVLPRPAYPPAAKAVRATGSVSVQILILEDGSVYSAEARSGHPLLRASSEIAACGARFSQTLLLGRPVKVSGIITYNYVP